MYILYLTINKLRILLFKLDNKFEDSKYFLYIIL